MVDLRKDFGLSDACYFGCPDVDFPSAEARLNAAPADISGLSELGKTAISVGDKLQRCNGKPWRPEQFHSAMPNVACGSVAAEVVIERTGNVLESIRP